VSDSAAPTNADLMAAIEALRVEVRQLRQQLPEQLVDIDQAAQHLGVSTRTVKRWVAEELIPYRRIGRALRFPLHALNAPRTDLAERLQLGRRQRPVGLDVAEGRFNVGVAHDGLEPGR
jgi:excisionase family DNA binding protein